MHMALETHGWTRADIDRMPEDGNRYEVVDGALFVTPPPSIGHERLHQAIARALVPYIERHELGELFNGHPVVILGNSHVEPDLIVSPTKFPRPESWEEMPRPILVVEILSPTSMRRDVVGKRALYQREGLPDYWIVDGQARIVRVITPTDEREESETLRWHPANAPAAFDIDLRALFDSAIGPLGSP